ncbi:MAG: DUF3795 domain-containing protein [Desulfobacteraceae bacterium]|nr:DUF3795 domain-containing protein [Desulfobacteraceae bacterium]
MIPQQILEAIAPCGLSCKKCFAHIDGDIRKFSRQLNKKLGNFDIYARRFETMVGDPIFKKYPDFKEMLDYFASDNCRGCRHEQCKLLKTCGVRACHQEKNLDYCYECEDFPCQKTGFDDHLFKRWVKMNQRIREVGIETYYEETKDTPRYV